MAIRMTMDGVIEFSSYILSLILPDHLYDQEQAKQDQERQHADDRIVNFFLSLRHRTDVQQ